MLCTWCGGSPSSVAALGPILPDLIGIQCTCATYRRISEAIADFVDCLIEQSRIAGGVGFKKIRLATGAERTATNTK